MNTHERVLDWTERGGNVDVRTDRATYCCRQMIVTAGAWAGKLLQDLQPVLTPERQVMLVHKGAITAGTRPGGGALFRLTF